MIGSEIDPLDTLRFQSAKNAYFAHAYEDTFNACLRVMSWMLRYSHEDEDGRKEVFAVTYQGRFLDFFQLLKEAGSHMGWDSNTTNKMNKMIAHYHDLAPEVQFNVEMFSIREQIYLVKNEIDQCAVNLHQSDDTTTVEDYLTHGVCHMAKIAVPYIG